MGSHGAIVSNKTFDVKDTVDRNILFSSAFQTLKIYSVSSVSTTIPVSGTNTITIDHDLGYYAPFFVIYNGSSSVGTTNSYFMCDSLRESFTWEFWANTRTFTDRVEIDVPDSFDDGTTGATVYFTVYIFLNKFTTISPETIGTTNSALTTADSYGIRISKDGYDVKSCADVDCILSSKFYNNVIHMAGEHTGATGGETYVVTHDLGYPPESLCYSDYAASGGINYIPTEKTDTTLEVALAEGELFKYIILKNKIG